MRGGMRKLPLSLLLVLLALFACSAQAQALTLPDVLGSPAEAADEEADEAEDENEDEAEGEDGSEECEIEDEEDVALCAEIAREEAEAERCVLEDATAKLAAHPGNRTVQLTIRYQAYAPASVAIDARLRGPHGGLHLDSEHTHFRRNGVYRDNFVLSEKQMERALGAREFTVQLQAVNTPRSCRFNLEGAPHQAKRSLRAGAPGRSDDRGRTRGK
jgi:hypothetical protein